MCRKTALFSEGISLSSYFSSSWNQMDPKFAWLQERYWTTSKLLAIESDALIGGIR